MSVRSTGQTGRGFQETIYNCHAYRRSCTGEEPPAGQTEPVMEMEITHPAHWTARTFLDPKDLRHMVMFIPSPIYGEGLM